MHRRIVITGVAGFIGTNLAEFLLGEGLEVIGIDDLSYGVQDRIPEGVTFHELDIRETEKIKEAFIDADVVIHLAALPRVQFSIDEPQAAHDVNVNGTLSVLEAAKQAGVKRVVLASSAAVYGDQETLPLREDARATPTSPYGLHKYVGEEYLKLWSTLYGIESVSPRFFNVYGPHFDPEGPYALVIGKFLKSRIDGSPLYITGDGEQTRDFVHVRDLAEGLLLAATSPQVGKGEVINLGSGMATSINRLAAFIEGDIEYIASRIEPRNSVADVTLAKELLGWSATTDLQDGILELKKTLGIQ